MEKRLLALLLAAILLLTPALPAYADNTLSSEEEVLELFAKQKKARAETFEFTCTKDLYEALTADNGRLLVILEIKGGISSCSEYTQSSKHLIEMKRVEYTDAPWVECKTEGEAARSTEQLLRDRKKEFTLICTAPTLARTMAKDCILGNAAARAGFSSIDDTYYNNGIIRIKDPKAFDKPYAVADDAAQFIAAAETFAKEKKDDFNIVFSTDFFSRLGGEELEILHFSAGMDYPGYGGLYGCPAALHYYRPDFTDEPCLVCRSEEDVVTAIQKMGTMGVSAFRLFLAGESLRENLQANSLRRLHELEAQAGMSNCSLSYTSKVLYYSEAKIVADVQALTTMDDALSYTEKMASEGAKEITLFCTLPLYENLLGDLTDFAVFHSGMNRIYDLVAHAGIFDYGLSASRNTRTITIEVNSFYPGTEIVRAVQTGNTAALSSKLQKTLSSAQSLAESCKADTQLETARRIHDALCDRVVYTIDDDTDEDDTAIGALLNGKANCDGYSDAFYLVGSLAGLHIRYQHGESLVQNNWSVSFGDSDTHMWNLLELDGTWRMVDVTWDDNEEYAPDYVWFNLGSDRASRTHKWNEDMTVELLKKTETDSRPENEYVVTSDQEMRAAVEKAVSSQESFFLLFENKNYTDYEAALKLISAKLSGSYRYSWEPKMGLLRVYTGEPREETP